MQAIFKNNLKVLGYNSIVRAMAYTATIGGKTIEVSRSAFIEANNKLSTQYHAEQDPLKKRQIIAILYDLDIRLFKSWQVYGDENRRDYEQEGYIWLTRALETFKPGKGSFISWLKWYILKAQTDVGEEGRRTAQTDNIEVDRAEEAPEDGDYWRRVKKLCNETEWVLIESQMLKGKTLKEVAADLNLTIHQCKSRYSDLLQKLRISAIPNHNDSQKYKSPIQPKNDDGSLWLTKTQLCDKFQIDPSYLKMLLNRNLAATYCPFVIDRHDYLEINGGRIRYLETTARGLIYPRFLRRKKGPQDGSQQD